MYSCIGDICNIFDPTKIKPQKIELGIYPNKINISECVKDLIEVSYKIYKQLLNEKKPITLICGGQSPAYYCLAMMNFSIYNEKKVNIIVLPHSKTGYTENPYEENKDYCIQLQKEKFKINNEVAILDVVYTGNGINALSSALKYCFSNIRNIKKIALNSNYIQTEVDERHNVKCLHDFSDNFPRIVHKYEPIDFKNKPMITKFINLINYKEDNQTKINYIAQMIIDIAKVYKGSEDITQTEWFKLNNYTIEGGKRKYIKLEKLTVKELQERCTKRKIAYKGKLKAELIAALRKK